MRNISAAMQTDLEKDVTTPSYLVRMQIPGGDVLFSTGQETVYDGITYPAEGGAVQRVNSSEATVMIINTDLIASNNAISNSFIDSLVDIRIAYDPAPALADAVLIFSGFADNPNYLNFDYVKVNCYAAPRIVSWSPRAFASPPTFNHLIPGGTVIGGVLLEPPNG